MSQLEYRTFFQFFLLFKKYSFFFFRKYFQIARNPLCQLEIQALIFTVFIADSSVGDLLWRSPFSAWLQAPHKDLVGGVNRWMGVWASWVAYLVAWALSSRAGANAFVCRVPFCFITFRSETYCASSFPVTTFWRGICQTPFKSPNNLCHLVFLSLLLLTATKDSNRLERTSFCLFFFFLFLEKDGFVFTIFPHSFNHYCVYWSKASYSASTVRCVCMYV